MRFSKQLVISLCVHVVVVLLLLLVTVNTAKKYLKSEPHRVQLVAGNETAPESTAPKPVETSKPEPPPPPIKPEMPKIVTRKVLGPKPKPRPIKSIAPLTEKAVDPIPKLKTTQPRRSPGTRAAISTGGDSVWDMLVQDRITRNWQQPSKAQVGSSSSTAEYEITVESSGKISSIVKKKSSGIPAMDNSAWAALKKSDPLPKLPQGKQRIVPIIFRLQSEL